MARIRSIKPEFFLDEDIAKLEPLTRILFQGLWCLADSEGRLEDRPQRIKIQILPYDKYDIERGLTDLHDAGFIIRYIADDRKLIQIRTFSKHQRISGKEAQTVSEYPGPERGSNGEATGKQPGSNGDQPESQERKGKERKGKEYILSGASPDIPYQEIIAYLNEKTGKHFEHESKQTRKFIKARWGTNGAKRTLQDFITVIDNKCRSWLNDPEMAAYLRPETLFGTKFESYLNEIKHPLSGKVSDKTIQNVEMLKEWRPPT